MKVEHQKFDVATAGLLASNRVTVEMTADLFQSTMNGLYSNKVLTPIRELATNAFDAHCEAGCPEEPWELGVPSHFNPHFWVRDFGPGMSHGFMTNETGYRKFFHSTKTGSNNQVGQKGIGRMSPFTYTTIYTVTTWQNGEQRDYTVYIGPDGVPDVAYVGCQPSKAPSGTKVSFPVKKEDLSRFRLETEKVLMGFKTRPRIVNETFDPPDPTVTYQGKRLTAYEQRSFPLETGLYARQGCVIYPISSGHLPPLPYSFCGILDFPIGELAVVTSREALDYNDLTVANLKTRIDEEFEAMAAGFVKQFEDEPTYWDACSKLNNTYGPLLDICRPRIQYKGHRLQTRFLISEGMLFWSGHSALGRLNPTLSFRDVREPVNLGIRHMESLQIYVEFEDCKFGPSRMRRVLQDADQDDQILWLRAESQAHLRLWPFKEWTDLSTIEPLKAPRKKSDKMTLRYLEAGNHNDTAKYDEVEPIEGLYYVVQDGTRFYPEGLDRPGLSLREMHSFLNQLVSVDMMDRGTRVYVLNKSARKKFKPKRYLSDEVSDWLRKEFKTDSLKIREGSYEVSHNREWAQHLLKATVPLPKSMADFAAKYSAQSNTGQALSGAALSLLRRFHREVFASADNVAARQQKEALNREFPMIGLILRNCYSNTKLLDHYLTLLSNQKD